MKRSVIAFIASRGEHASESDSFTINTDGSITVENSTDDSVPDVPVAAKNTVVVGEATVFGLNYDGSIDPGDNGIGAWGAQTRNRNIIGVSLPEEVMIATLGFTGTWEENKARVGKFLADNAIRASVTKDGKTSMADVVDAGPAAFTHNAIDLTYALAHLLNTNGKAIVSYSIIKDGYPMEIKGWDFVNGVEIKVPGVA